MQDPRCDWCLGDSLYQQYHDQEWGRPLFDEQRLFEFLLLEGAQAGLSWLTVLRKRENYRAALDGFDPHKIARYGDADIARLLQNPGIIRNRRKINSAVRNARAWLALKDAGRDPVAFFWQFVDGRPIQNRFRRTADLPASTALSDALSKALKQADFSFVGSTICYAHMQATGMVNDHLISCPQYAICADLARRH
jgi:DNA-3-methyladenine glycosylase I